MLFAGAVLPRGAPQEFLSGGACRPKRFYLTGPQPLFSFYVVLLSDKLSIVLLDTFVSKENLRGFIVRADARILQPRQRVNTSQAYFLAVYENREPHQTRAILGA